MSKKIVSFFITLILIFSLSMPFNISCLEKININEPVKVQVVSFNDFHGNLIENGKNIGAAKLVAEVKRLKKENSNTIVLSGGDIFQGTAISNLLYGEPITKMLQQLGVEYSAVGNHEFDWGLSYISEWAKQGNFKFLASNIYDKTTNKPVDWAEPFSIKEVEGKKIGFIGLTTPETAYKTKLENIKNIEFKDLIESTKYWVNFLKNEKKVDAIVLLGHIGSEQDENTKVIKGEAADIANSVNGIDAIISSHTHKVVSGKVNGVSIIQAGYNGRAIGKLNFTFNNDGKVLVNEEVNNLSNNVTELPIDKDMQEIVDKYLIKLNPILQEVVTKVNVELNHSKTDGLSPLGQFISQYIRKVTNTDVVVYNGGGLRKPLQAGEITVGDMWEVLPFDNTLVTMKLKGADLKKVIENGILNDKIGWIQYYGLRVYYDKTKEVGNRITSMRLLDGSKIDMDRYYTVTTNDFVAEGGDGYDFSNGIDKNDTGIPIRDALINEFKKNPEIQFEFDYNTLIAGNDPANNEFETPEDNTTNGSVDNENKVDNSQLSNIENNNSQLPKTGIPIKTEVLIMFGVLSVVVGLILIKKKIIS